VVIEAEGGGPIYAADVVLLTAGDTVVARCETARDGRFILRAPGPGTYRLRAARIGYSPLESNPFVVGPGQDAVAELSLELRPIPLDPIEATVERPRARALELAGFYRRQEAAVGQFLTPEDIAARNLHRHRDLFSQMSGIVVGESRTGEVSIGKRLGMCGGLSVFIDGQAVVGGGNFNVGTGSWTSLVAVQDIAAVEVYTSVAGVPGWASRLSPCGAVLVWTR